VEFVDDNVVVAGFDAALVVVVIIAVVVGCGVVNVLDGCSRAMIVLEL
jgi:hypothetical protein